MLSLETDGDSNQCAAFQLPKELTEFLPNLRARQGSEEKGELERRFFLEGKRERKRSRQLMRSTSKPRSLKPRLFVLLYKTRWNYVLCVFTLNSLRASLISRMSYDTMMGWMKDGNTRGNIERDIRSGPDRAYDPRPTARAAGEARDHQPCHG